MRKERSPTVATARGSADAVRLVAALHDSEILLVGVDADATVRVLNPAAEHATGLPRDQVLNHPFTERFLIEDLRAEHGRVIGEAAAGKGRGTFSLESGVPTNGGDIRDVEWLFAYVAPRCDGDVTLFAIGRDMTEHRTLVTRTRDSAKRTTVASLIAGISHEIRNPLNGAHLHLTLLERRLERGGFDDAETVAAIEVIRDEIRRLSMLVTEFLDFARPHPLQCQKTDVAALCHAALARVACQAVAVGVVLHDDLPPTEVTAQLDPGKLEQALCHLLQNAIEASPREASSVVTLHARRSLGEIVFEVEDEGPGIPPGVAVFDPFFSTKPDGTGLGLALVRRIVEDHLGTVVAERRRGHTVLRITLPLRPGPAAQSAAQERGAT